MVIGNRLNKAIIVLLSVITTIILSVFVMTPHYAYASDDQLSLTVPTKLPCVLLGDGTIIEPDWKVINPTGNDATISAISVDYDYLNSNKISAQLGFGESGNVEKTIDLDVGKTSTTSQISKKVEGNKTKLLSLDVDFDSTNKNVYNLYTAAINKAISICDVSMTYTMAVSGSLAISGDKVTGSVITSTLSDFPSDGTPQYQWYRDGSPISGATGTTYTVVDADIGTVISCRVTDGTGKYTGQVVSNEVGKIQAVVYFKDWNGTVLKTERVEKGEGATAPSNPTRTGYTFTGWNPSDFTSITTNTTIIAQYRMNIYTISYNLNSGTNPTTNPATYTVETSTITLKDPTRTGYTFTGWTGSNGTTPQKGVTIAKGSTGNKSYTANWQLATYTITYNMNSGTNPSSNPKSYNITSNAITLTAPTRTGYTFKGWTGSNGTTPQKSVTIAKGSTGNKTYTANWTINTYSISYSMNSGTNPSTNPTTYTVDTATITLKDPTRNGYTFTGWTGSNGTTPQKGVTIAKGSTGNKNYTANWQLATYTITYNMNSGTNPSSNPKSYNITSNAITLTAPTRTGYTFKGWTGSNGTTPQKSVTIAKGSTGNKTYTANWTINTYTVSFVTNGGSSITKQTVNYGSKATKPSSNPTKSNSKFLGYFSDESCTTTFNWNTAITKNTTVYVNWASNMYRLRNPYSLKDGTTGTYLSYVWVSDATEIANLKKAGWVYEGYQFTVTAASTVPVYRYCDNSVKGGTHYYTKTKTSASRWTYEGVAFGSCEKTTTAYPITELTLDSHYVYVGSHEVSAFKSLGWTNNGTKFYVYSTTELK